MVLVDDVLTTGATAQACARALMDRGRPRNPAARGGSSGLRVGASKRVYSGGGLERSGGRDARCGAGSDRDRPVGDADPRGTTAYRTTPGRLGPPAEQAVLLQAIETLPKPLKPFYKEHRLEMPSSLPEATAPERVPIVGSRSIASCRFPSPTCPGPRAEMKKRFGDRGREIGRLPWLVQESYARLVEAFKSRDKTKILEESDALASLVAEIHNPLALTDNGDGQKTGQHGLWIRSSGSLEAMKNRLKVEPDAARYLDEPEDYVFSMIGATYVWLDNLLYLEELARKGKAGYAEIFFESFEMRAGRDVARAALARRRGRG